MIQRQHYLLLLFLFFIIIIIFNLLNTIGAKEWIAVMFKDILSLQPVQYSQA